MRLEARHLGRRRPDSGHWLLHDVSLTIERGDRLALLGPSGSGKTVLLRALAFLDPLDSGEIVWNGERIEHDRVPVFRRAVVYLHQRPVFFEGNVEQNLRLPCSLQSHHNADYDRERIVTWLNRLNRDRAFLTKRQQDLSGGEAQITALLRALQLDPDVLLLDEPTAALDNDTARAVEELVVEWSAERAVVWVSHELAQAQRITNRSLIIDAGRLSPGDR